ncbi:FAD-binding oxidoreductase [Streptomyces sp. SID1121]|uniref:FAD-binding oxidoreductase n=1 Tax=Streptomyces sp. SID1121 TaxID=3425888 RepID=UPI004056384E
MTHDAINDPGRGDTWDRALAALAAGAEGPVLTPGEPGYEDELAVFNLAVTHHPAVAVGATDTADVSLAVRTAGTLGLAVAILNTGHGPALPATPDTLLITTSRMTDLTVDPAARTARIQAGVRFQQLVDATAAHGLAPLPGSSPGVGVVGYTLGGGASPIMGRAHGWAADHVTALEVVTADGEIRQVSPQAGSDLFSAVLGGKSNFGVVTAMEFGLFPVTRLYGGALFYAGTDTRTVLEAYRRFTTTAPDDMSSGIALFNLPPLPDLPEFMRGKPAVSLRLSYLGQADEGEALIAPLRRAAPVLMDTVSEKPLTAFGSLSMDPTDPTPAVEHFGLLDALTEDTVQALADGFGPGSGITLVDLRHLQGAYGNPPATPNAVGARDAAFSLFALTVVPPGQDVSAYATSGADLFERLAPWLSEAKHPGFLSPADATPQQTRKAYAPEVYERLRAVKAHYDPDNTFRINHNIPPQENA